MNSQSREGSWWNSDSSRSDRNEHVPSVAKLWLHQDGLNWLGDGVLIRDGSGFTNAKFSLECSKKNCREEEETQMVGRIKALKQPKWAKDPVKSGIQSP